MPESSLRNSIRVGTSVSLGCQLGSQVVSLIVLAALYKWVPQEDFGLIAAAQLLVMLPRTVVTLGLNAAGIQKSRLELSHLRGLFWWNLTLGIAAAVMTAIAVPVVAYFKESAELPRVGYALSLSAVVASLGMAHQTVLERELRLPALQAIRLFAQAVSGGLAVGAAWSGWGIWALVVQNYVELLLLAGGCWMASPFWPGSPRNASSAQSFLRFGGLYSLVSLLFYLSANLDKILLYALLPNTESGLAVFGMYQQAYHWMMRPVLAVTTPVTAVMLPALSRVQADRLSFERLAVGFYRLVGAVLIPSSVGLFVVAEDAMVALGGTPWQPAGTLLRALAPVVLVQGFINISGSVFTAAAQMRAFLFGAVCLSLVQAQGLAAGYYFGTRAGNDPLSAALGTAWGYSLTAVLVVAIPYLWFCCRSVRISLGTLLRTLRTPLLAASIMGVIVWYGRGGLLTVSPWTRLLASLLLGVVVYVWIMRRELRSIWHEFGSHS